MREQINALDQFHGEEPALTVGEQIPKSNHVRVADVRGRTELFLEPAEQGWLQTRKQLERNPKAQLSILGLVDDTHASLSQQTNQAKALRPAKPDRSDFARNLRSKHVSSCADVESARLGVLSRGSRARKRS